MNEPPWPASIDVCADAEDGMLIANATRVPTPAPINTFDKTILPNKVLNKLRAGRSHELI
ncbi:hypothetical protein [Variovorax sp. ZT4R33]|uniref:hypothetical protein n=1 Tax=Variovorax sp. ZT4R33 TaxID=3443743 RepID=UPI003F48E31A